MKRWIGIGVVAAALGAAVIWGWQHLRAGGPTAISPLIGGAQPRIDVPETTYNFGTLDQHKTGAHAFPISNLGSRELRLSLVQTNCGCTRVKLKELEWNPKLEMHPPKETIRLAPGEKSSLEITWDTESKYGPFRTSVRLATSDPDRPTVDLYLEGEVLPVVVVNPMQLKLSELRSDAVTTATLHVLSPVVEDLEVHQKNTTDPRVHVTFTSLDQEELSSWESKSGYEGKIQVDPGLPIGPFRATVTIGTNLADRPELTVGLYGRVTGDVRLDPSDKMDFQIVRLSKGKSQTLFVKISSEEVVQAEVARRTPEFLQVSLDSINSSKNFFRLSVQVPANEAPGGNFQGVVELETSHPTAKLIKIPVRGQVIR